MCLLFFQTSEAKAMMVFTVFYHLIFITYKVFTSFFFLKGSSVWLAVGSVANKTLTCVRNVKGKRGAVLQVVQSHD